MANSLLGQEQRIVDQRIQATIQDEIDYLTKYGEEYWNSGTAESSPLGFGLFSRTAQDLGASGRGQRALTNLQTINNQMQGGYSDEDLWNMFNDELINTFPENETYRLAMDLIDREGNYGGGEVDRQQYQIGGPIAKAAMKKIKGLLGKKGGIKELVSSDEQKLVKYFEEANKRNFPDRDAQLTEGPSNPMYDPADMARQIKESYNELLQGKAEFQDGFFTSK